MSIPTTPHSIIEYFHPPPPIGHRCGYCKSPNTNHQHGMWAHRISPENYEHLINRGWSRSGSYIYKPMSEKICCPTYTIRHLAQRVLISRSQRKVLKRFRKYLKDGEVPSNGQPLGKYFGGVRMEEVEDVIHVNKKEPSAPSALISPRATTLTTDMTTNKAHHPLKKKHLRRERKRQKLQAKGLDPDEFFRRNERDRVKELETFFEEGREGDKLEFSTKLVNVESPEFQKYLGMEHALYRKYMMTIHGDSEDECKESDYKRFYCDNPFFIDGNDDSDSEGNDERPDTNKAKGKVLLGTYHQHYYISSTLIAVGVMDILPHSIYSASFFYDPDYSFLNPGTLGALHEIHFMNELAKSNPKMEYYHLGFYIHSCVKMKYKSQFKPCQLLCSPSGDWVEFDGRVAVLLDSVKGGFVKLGMDEERGGPVINHDDLIDKIVILYNGIRRFKDFLEIISSNNEDNDKRRGFQEMMESYVNLVGPTVASNMVIYVPYSPIEENSPSSDESSEHDE